MLDQLALRAWVLECCARWEDVATALPYVQDYAQRLQREPEQAQVLAQELRLAERRGDAEAAAAAAKALAARLLQLPLRVLHGLEVLLEGTQERVLRIAPELASILLNIPGPRQVVPYLRAAAPDRA